MKEIVSLIAVIALSAQTAFAQLSVTPNGANAVVNQASALPTPFVIDMKYYSNLGMPPGTYVPFTIVGLPTATGGAIVLPPMPMTASTYKTATVNIPAHSQHGTIFLVTVTGTIDGGLTTTSQTITITVYSIVAVEMVVVNAKSSQGKNLITWSTASEKDNGKFVVERSVNGLNFVPIGEVKSVGTSQTLNNYSFTDANLKGSVNYYRIKAIDMADKESTSKVVAVASKGSLAVNATRSEEGSKINIASDSEGAATIRIYNTNGQVVANQVISTTSGVSEHVVNLNQCGMFIVNVTKGQSTVSTKIFR